MIIHHTSNDHFEQMESNASAIAATMAKIRWDETVEAFFRRASAADRKNLIRYTFPRSWALLDPQIEIGPRCPLLMLWSHRLERVLGDCTGYDLFEASIELIVREFGAAAHQDGGASRC